METQICCFCKKNLYKYQKIIYEDDTFDYKCKQCYLYDLHDIWRNCPKQIKNKEYYICEVKLDVPSKESLGYKEFIEDDEFEQENKIYCNHLEYMKKRYFTEEFYDESDFQHENKEKREATTVFKNMDGEIYAFCDDCLDELSSQSFNFYKYLKEFGKY